MREYRLVKLSSIPFSRSLAIKTHKAPLQYSQSCLNSSMRSKRQKDSTQCLNLTAMMTNSTMMLTKDRCKLKRLIRVVQMTT